MLARIIPKRSSLHQRLEQLKGEVKKHQSCAFHIEIASKNAKGEVVDVRAKGIIASSAKFLRELSKIEDMAKSLKEKELHSSSPTAFLIRTPLVKEVESKISKLSLAIAVDMDVAMDTSIFRSSISFLCRFAYSGTPQRASSIDPGRDFEPKNLLAKAKVEYAGIRSDLLQQFDLRGEDIGDSYSARLQDLSRNILAILPLREDILLIDPMEHTMVAEKEQLTDNFITLSHDVVSAVSYFYFAQRQARHLVDQHTKVAKLIGNFIQKPYPPRSREEIELLRRGIQTELQSLKTMIAKVVLYHDIVAEELKKAKEQAEGDCNADLCKEQFERLVAAAKSPATQPPSSNHVFGWICRSCAFFTEENVRRLVQEHSKKPMITLSDADLECMGEGGFAHIYEIVTDAKVQQLNRAMGSKLVVKIVESKRVNSAALYQRIIRELVIWSNLDHPNIVPLVGFCVVDKLAKYPCPINPLLEGGPLLDMIHNAPINLQNRMKRLGYMRDVASALAYMHDHPLRIVHADLKPDNILIHEGKAYLIDFGISRMAAYKGMSTGIHGNDNFLAPELIEGRKRSGGEYLTEDYCFKPSTFADVYSFGMTFYHMCSGQVPFGIGCRPGDAYETPPYDDSFDLFPEYWDFVERCLAGIPMSRPSACEVHKQMEDFLKSIPP